MSIYGAGHKRVIDQLLLLPSNPSAIPLPGSVSRVMTPVDPVCPTLFPEVWPCGGAFWPRWGAVPRAGSGQDPGGAQKPRLRAAVLRADGKSDQGLSKQHSPHLGICKWDSPKCDVESVSEVSFGCEPRKGWVGAESGEKGRDEAAPVARVSPWFENENRKRSPGRKGPGSRSRDISHRSAGICLGQP